MNLVTLRNADRESAWKQCLIRIDRTNIVRGLLTNASDTGAEIRCKFPFESEQRVEVFSSTQVSHRHARIVRNDGNSYGIKWT